MAKLPKMNLFVDAFNSDTSYLTEEELGMYFRLIMYAWTHEATLPKDKDILYNLPKVKNDDLVDKIVRLFFTEEDSGYVQKRLKKEYDYAISVSNKASESASSRWSANAMRTHTKGTATTTTTTTKTINNNFDIFWKNIDYKVSKGQARINFMKLSKENQERPLQLAELFNDYYNNLKDKTFARHPSTWLSAEGYEDEIPKTKEFDKEEHEAYRLKGNVEMYKKGIRLLTWSKQDMDEFEEIIAKEDN